MEAMTWNLHPTVVLGSVAWTGLYALASRRTGRTGEQGRAVWQPVAFHLGTLIFTLALISPLDDLGDQKLFSAHMAQHLLILFAAAPLWVAGTPAALLEGSPSRALAIVRVLTKPVPSEMVFAALLLFWHHPAAAGWALESESIHIAQHLSYVGAGLIGWWPLLGVGSDLLPKPGAPVRILHSFLLALPCTLIGALFTFSQVPLYGFYASAAAGGFDALEDQRLAGLLMWVPTHMVLIAVAATDAARWLEGDRTRSLHQAATTQGEP